MWEKKRELLKRTSFSRWWPAEVSHPKTIPDNIQRMRHDVGEFPVHFFGSNDYLWTYQARVFPYMDVDANSKEKMGKGVDATYRKGKPAASTGSENTFLIQFNVLCGRYDDLLCVR